MSKRALIADDQADYRVIWRLVAESYGLEVVEATSGSEALSILRHDIPFDLVVLDVVMPDPDGFEVFRQMREDERLKAIPVIFSTNTERKKEDLTEIPVDDRTFLFSKGLSGPSLVNKMGREIEHALGME